MNRNNQKHGFHLVDVSPWPIISAFSALMLTFGAVLYMHGYVEGFFLCRFGLVMILFMMFIWWGDVIKKGVFKARYMYIVKQGLFLGVLTFILSKLILFFDFLWSFFHFSFSPSSMIGGIWTPAFFEILNPWGIYLLSTVALSYFDASLGCVNHKSLILGIGSIILVFHLGFYLSLMTLFGVSPISLGLNRRFSSFFFNLCSLENRLIQKRSFLYSNFLVFSRIVILISLFFGFVMSVNPKLLILTVSFSQILLGFFEVFFFWCFYNGGPSPLSLWDLSLVFAKVFGGKVFKLITHPGMVFPVGGAIEHYYTNNFSFKDQEGNTRGYTPLTSIFRACSGDIHPGKVISGLVAPYRVSREIIEVENADIDYRSYKKKLSDLVSSGQITLSEYEAQIKKSQNLNESIRKEVFERPFFPHLSPKK